VQTFEAPARVREFMTHGEGAIADALEQAATKALAAQDLRPARDRDSEWIGLTIDGARLVLTDGTPANQLAAGMGIADLAVFDRPVGWPSAATTPGIPLAYAINPRAGKEWQAQAPAWLHALGFLPLAVADAPGLVVARTLAMLINEAADAVLQGVCTTEGADAAMKLGVNYPQGPFEWLRGWSVAGVVSVLEAVDATYRGERYRVSPWLRIHP
jgi:3-hydroxybutyryl-CoA dehydrogenase